MLQIMQSCKHCILTLLGDSKAMEVILHCGCLPTSRAATSRANQLISTHLHELHRLFRFFFKFFKSQFVQICNQNFFLD